MSLPLSFNVCLCAISLLSAHFVCAGTSPQVSETPLWHPLQNVANEPVLFIRADSNSPAQGQLLFEPRRLLGVYSNDRSTEYPVADFAIRGRAIVYTGSSALPGLQESELILDEKTPTSFGHYIDGQRYILYQPNAGLVPMQLSVDYETDASWSGAVPAFKPELLPRLQHKLAQAQPVSIVFLGDSITAGGDASAHMRQAPYRSPYTAQLAERIGAATGSAVSVHNLSKGGQSSPWAVAQAEAAAALKPDLLVIAFGMNDASWSGVPVEDYAGNILTAMQTVKKLSPDTEFVLVSPMTPNPLWNRERPALRAAYHDRLMQMEKPGVLVCDVRSPWLHLVERKGFLSLSGNGLNHPNDYGHRLYADVLSQSILGPAGWQHRP